MNTEILARIQFAVTAAFHYFFPPMTIGLAMILVIMEGAYLLTKNEAYKRMTYFWVKVFALIFSIGVATGLVMEFEFGTNWATYSRYVGDIFGSALAAEGVFAFFLESGFLAILVFGWNRVSPKVHFLSTIMVAIGSTFSAVWIIVANSWMQTPAGYKIVQTPLGPRAHVTSFWAMVFNPSTVDRLSHTVTAAWLTGAFLVISVAAYYLRHERHVDFAKASMKIGLGVAAFGCLAQLYTGHMSAVGVAHNQPAKLAAMEGHFEDGKLDSTVIGYVDQTQRKVVGLTIPGMGSAFLGSDAPVPGLNNLASVGVPPVQPVFQGFHLMIMIWGLMSLIVVAALIQQARGKLATSRKFLKVMAFAVILPQIANQSGWFTAELGRQPWIVYGMLKTSDGLSKAVSAGHIVASLVMFTVVYAMLFALFVYLLDRKIKEGPDEQEGFRLSDVEIGAPIPALQEAQS